MSTDVADEGRLVLVSTADIEEAYHKGGRELGAPFWHELPDIERERIIRTCALAIQAAVDARRSPDTPVTVGEKAWETLKHQHRPIHADYEVEQLKKRIAQFGPTVPSEILTTYALMQPAQGSYAGSLWALAEWAQTQATRSRTGGRKAGLEEAGKAWRWASSGEWRPLSPGLSQEAINDFVRDQERIAPVVIGDLYAIPSEQKAGS